MGGAVAAAAAAKRMREINEVLDAYRLAGATSPDRQHVPDALGIGDHHRAIRDLASGGALVSGTKPGAYFLSEQGYITYRESRRTRRMTVVLVALLLAVIGAGWATWLASAKN